jgi:hypothetical protein
MGGGDLLGFLFLRVLGEEITDSMKDGSRNGPRKATPKIKSIDRKEEEGTKKIKLEMVYHAPNPNLRTSAKVDKPPAQYHYIPEYSS